MRRSLPIGPFAWLALSATALVALLAPLCPVQAAQDGDREMMSSAQASLAWKLMGQPTAGASVAISPAGLSSAFSVLALGADARMKAALLKATGLGPMDGAVMNSAHDALSGSDPAIFVSKDRVVFPPSAAPSDLALAGLRALGVSYDVADLSRPDGVKSVDDWVRDATQGAIPAILGRALDHPAFVSLNALRYKAKWKEAFDPKATVEARFRSADGKSEPAMLMRLSEAPRAYRTENGFVGVEVPFAAERYALVVVTSLDQPKALRAFEPVKSWLSGEGFSSRNGDLALPRFHLESEVDLLPALRGDLADAMKAPSAFAGFGVAASLEGVRQRTRIDVDEEGATAAAVTAVQVGRALAVDDAVHMIVDKPFLFALRDRESGLILAAGFVAHADN